MTERRFLALGVLAASALVLSGHSPYRQWFVYRQKHLVVVTAELRPGALELAATVAAAVVARWPESKAVPAAAKTPVEVVRLLDSGQLHLALIPAGAALAALEGRAPFAQVGKVPLRALALLGDDVLVVVEGFARDKARVITQAVAEHRGAWPLDGNPQLRGPAPIPFHEGAIDHYEARATKR